MRAAVLPVLLAALAVAGCGGGGGSGSADATSASAAPAERTDAQRQAILASLPAPYNAADLENGRRVFGTCRSCHSIAEGGPNLIGPHLFGVFGRRAGSLTDYDYSQQLRASGLTWDDATMDRWLTRPRDVVPGTKMAFAGIQDPTRRRDLIAYLHAETSPVPAQ